MGEVIQFPVNLDNIARLNHNKREAILLSWLRAIMQDHTHWEIAMDIVWTEMSSWYKSHYHFPEEAMEAFEAALVVPFQTVQHECQCEACI